MATLRERMDASGTAAAEVLAENIRQQVEARWRPVLEEHRKELEAAFEQRADAAYAVYSRMLLDPIGSELQELRAGGYTVEPEFPGSFRDSAEPDTAPDERVRSFWCLVSRDDQPVGALVYRLFHDHSRFRVWRAPVVTALPLTEPAEVRAAVSRL